MTRATAPARSPDFLTRQRERLLAALRVVGRVQARLLLTIVFFLVFAPYGLLLRLFRVRLGHAPGWHVPDPAEGTLARLRRMF